MLFLEKLWRGEISPLERYVRSGSEYKKVSCRMCDELDKLVEMLSPEAKQHYENAERLRHEANSIEQEDTFYYGFRMGARMILDVVGEYRGQFYDAGEAE